MPELRAKVAELRTFVNSNVGLPPTGSGQPHDDLLLLPLIAASALAALGLTANAAYVLRRRD